MSIESEQLKLQLRTQERELQATGQMINELTQLLAEERLHTQKLIEQSQQKPQPQPEAIALLKALSYLS